MTSYRSLLSVASAIVGLELADTIRSEDHHADVFVWQVSWR